MYSWAMKETPIALENASPGLAEWVARARREHTTFVVLDASVPVARLVPTAVPSCTGAELARALATTDLSPDEARAWADDLRQSRAALSVPDDKWR
jgi:antitoxin (DNA-binding transcriptional repressor) of toxin-antitoxin stability system